jgi:N-methylhydantoinase B
MMRACHELHAYAERRTRAAISRMPDGHYEARETVETLEGELELRVAVEIAGDEVTIDFAGSAGQYRGNLNCPLAVTQAACYFVVRVLTDPDGPASGGAHAPVHVRAPLGSLLNPLPPCAVVAGNVETSSRITDCVMRAFSNAVETPAQGQGTMNNITLGNSRFTYYETIGGGQGASPGGNGPSGVHVAMSNTLNTPVEALEIAYPLRVERYALRRDSRGEGLHAGGEGVIRAIRVLEPCDVSILSDRRVHRPRGAAGGGAGAPGLNTINSRSVGAKFRASLQAGDVVTVVTPGGGGFGAPVPVPPSTGG